MVHSSLIWKSCQTVLLNILVLNIWEYASLKSSFPQVSHIICFSTFQSQKEKPDFRIGSLFVFLFFPPVYQIPLRIMFRVTVAFCFFFVEKIRRKENNRYANDPRNGHDENYPKGRGWINSGFLFGGVWLITQANQFIIIYLLTDFVQFTK